MKLKTLGLITAALLGGALMPAGFAQDGEGDARRSFERRGPEPQRLIERLDEDGDSELSFEEFNARRLEAAYRGFERLDANADGLLDGGELERPERPERRARLPRRGRETVADYDPPPAPDRLAYLDTDGNGVVDGNEWSAAMEERQRHLFNRLDVDDDGFISVRDLASFREQEINLRRVLRACIHRVQNASE